MYNESHPLSILHSDRLMRCIECQILKNGKFERMPDYWKYQPRYISEPHYFVLDGYMPIYVVYACATRESIRMISKTHSLSAARALCRMVA